ncbi:uncharacterized protein BJ171DRAFT_215853 [Polychytrium aggregatum]|uniref:uncharacterized protein n=1 Tax=Polychytrium aggregatum TaxID=110093 RepID=UPI0022FF094A|nr:uncharacterized protein BJ171DRAFT_215853 [Polychytrium aggregatum]KAI9199302.1 hypothetical protein BJ171DRAFT_215853 [Polychytrium aggregatum]
MRTLVETGLVDSQIPALISSNKSDDVFIRAQGANSEVPGHRGGSAKCRPHPTSRRASEALEKNVACSIHVSIDDGGALVAVECLGCPKVSLDEPAVGAGLAGVLFTDHPDNGAILLCLALHSVHESTVGQLDHALSVALADVSEAMAVELRDEDDVVVGTEPLGCLAMEIVHQVSDPLVQPGNGPSHQLLLSPLLLGQLGHLGLDLANTSLEVIDLGVSTDIGTPGCDQPRGVEGGDEIAHTRIDRDNPEITLRSLAFAPLG